jgi:hypothetical protein
MLNDDVSHRAVQLLVITRSGLHHAVVASAQAPAGGGADQISTDL